MIKAKYTGLFLMLFLMPLLMLVLPVSLIAATQQTSDQNHDHHQDVNKRGDHAMGFSHDKTTHHFRLTSDGGSIEVTANDPKDAESVEQIRHHLAHIARLFKEGDFSAPMFVHDQVPPGVSAMKALKGSINYTFASIDRGARVRIATANAEAIEAIHEFLKFQINDHQTGDSLEPDKQAATDHHCKGLMGMCPMSSGSRLTDQK